MPKALFLVQDYEASRGTLILLLALTDHQIHITDDHQKAMEVLQNFAPDIVILDLQLPNDIRLGLCAAARLLPSHPQIALVSTKPFGVQSACRSEMATELGADTFITLPSGLSDIISAATNHADLPACRYDSGREDDQPYAITMPRTGTMSWREIETAAMEKCC